MELTILIIAIVSLIYVLFLIIEFMVGFKLLKNLSGQSVIDKNKYPSITIILSALNEETYIERTLNNLLNIDYPDLEIIAINDRSSDATPEIMNRMQKRYPRLQVHHIHELPEGWFGKNHALHLGSQHAKGDWLLFTDADVIMKPDILYKTMSYVLENKLDHITICERHLRNSFWLKILLLAHYLTYTMNCRPWRIRYTWSNKSLGHGAFNLVSKAVYEDCGGHRAIALECLDDMKLGAIIKQKGYNQDTVDGRDFIEREWYLTLQNMVEGWKKNTFAYYEYRLLPLIRDSAFAAIFFIWPVFAAIFLSGWQRWLNVAIVCLTAFMFAYVAKQFRMQKRYAIFYPISIAILVFTVWNSVFAIYTQKGVVWRGTHYSLKRLKSKKAP